MQTAAVKRSIFVGVNASGEACLFIGIVNYRTKYGSATVSSNATLASTALLRLYNSFVKRDSASNPLTERYASREMSFLFSADFKFRTWRRLWIALAEAEKELGLAISDAQIAELKANADDINYEEAERREREVR